MEMEIHVNNIRTYNIREREDNFDKWNEQEFFNRFRLSKETVRDVILPQIENQLTNEHIRYHEVSALDQLMLAIRFYATGNFYITIGDFGGIHKTTAANIINRVTTALISLSPNYIKFPEDPVGKRNVQVQFFDVARFPKVIGAIDCTHIKIQSPGGENAEFFRNRKGYFSLNVQAVSDSRNHIMDIVARWPGYCHDSHIFMNSSLKTRFEQGEFDDAVLLGDSGYALMDFLMTPLGNPQTRAEELYNSSHISTRTVVERTFGIWKRRFPILSTGIRCNIPLAQKIITATAILHNIAVSIRENEDFPYQEYEENNIGNELVPAGLNIIQQRYIRYFQTLL